MSWNIVIKVLGANQYYSYPQSPPPKWIKKDRGMQLLLNKFTQLLKYYNTYGFVSVYYAYYIIFNTNAHFTSEKVIVKNSFLLFIYTYFLAT